MKTIARENLDFENYTIKAEQTEDLTIIFKVFDKNNVLLFSTHREVGDCMDDYSDDNVDHILNEFKNNNILLSEDEEEWFYSMMHEHIYFMSKEALAPLNAI